MASFVNYLPGTVYAVVDPRNGEVRYVGATQRPLPHRLKQHVQNSNGPLFRLIKDVRAAGLQPVIEPLLEDVPGGDLFDAERREIRRHVVELGCVLLNVEGNPDADDCVSRAAALDLMQRAKRVGRDEWIRAHYKLLQALEHEARTITGPGLQVEARWRAVDEMEALIDNLRSRGAGILHDWRVTIRWTAHTHDGKDPLRTPSWWLDARLGTYEPEVTEPGPDGVWCVAITLPAGSRSDAALLGQRYLDRAAQDLQCCRNVVSVDVNQLGDTPSRGS